jgi:hypothetical protein
MSQTQHNSGCNREAWAKMSERLLQLRRSWGSGQAQAREAGGAAGAGGLRSAVALTLSTLSALNTPRRPE